MNKMYKGVFGLVLGFATVFYCMIALNVCSVFADTIAEIDFKTAESFQLFYNNASEYLDGADNSKYVFSNSTEYTDENTGITYYADNGVYYGYPSGWAQYGIKPTNGKKIISFSADQVADYIITVTGTTGSATLQLYTEDPASGTAVASAAAATGETSVRYSNADTGTKIYVAVADSNNFYMGSIVIATDEYTDPSTIAKVNVKGKVTGLEDDDTDAKITFSNGSGSIVDTTASDFETVGVELIDGAEYLVTAVGKGVYTATSFTAAETEEQAIQLNRIKFEFPIELADNFNNLELYLGNVAYADNKYTDSYSKITVYENGMKPYTAQYGAKTNSSDILEFTAENAGNYAISVTVTTYNEGDQLQLCINGSAVDDTMTDLNGNTTYTMTVTAHKGDVIKLSAPTHVNIYYSYIDVTYEPLASDITRDLGVLDSSPQIDGSYTLYLVVGITADDYSAIDKVGFIAAPGELSSVSDILNSGEKIEVSGVNVYKSFVKENGNSINASAYYGDYMYIAKLTGVKAGTSLTFAAYTTKSGEDSFSSLYSYSL